MPAMVVSDFVNPLVVKEVRQGLRTKVFWFCFALLLLACLGAAMAAFAQHRAGDVVDLGPRYFFLFFVALSAVEFFVVPFGAFRSLSREREDDTWTLLVLTGLSARRILRGKVTSALLQGGVYASAVAPFILFSYFLNGIDLPTLLTVLGLSAVLAFSLCCMAVAAATVGTRGPTRALAHLGIIALLGGATLVAIGAGRAFSDPRASLLAERWFWPVALGNAWLLVAMAVLSFEAAVARLAPSTSSYAAGLRLAYVVIFAVSSVLAHFAWRAVPAQLEMAAAFQVLFAFVFGVLGALVASDADGAELRQRVRWWSPLAPGALRAYRLVLFALLASGAHWLWAHSNATVVGFSVFAEGLVWGAPFYAVLYLSLTMLAGRLPFESLRRLGTPASTRLALLSVLLIGLLPALLGAASRDEATRVWLQLSSPFTGLFNFLMAVRSSTSYAHRSQDELLLVLGVAAALTALAADRVLAWRDRR